MKKGTSANVGKQQIWDLKVLIAEDDETSAFFLCNFLYPCSANVCNAILH